MRQIYFTLVMVLLCGSVFAQRPEELGLYNYKHTVTYTDHKAVFQLKEMSDQGNIENGKSYYWYANNQIKISQGGYSGRLLNGSFNAFYLDNSLKEQGIFENGLKVGEWKKWNTQGKLYERAQFKKGILNGTFYKYNTLGDVLETGAYQNGKMKGAWKTYVNADSTTLTYYKNGVSYVPRANLWKRIFAKKSKPLKEKS